MRKLVDVAQLQVHELSAQYCIVASVRACISRYRNIQDQLSGSGGVMAFAPSGLSWSRRLYSDATHRGASACAVPTVPTRVRVR